MYESKYKFDIDDLRAIHLFAWVIYWHRGGDGSGW